MNKKTLTFSHGTAVVLTFCATNSFWLISFPMPFVIFNNSNLISREHTVITFLDTRSISFQVLNMKLVFFCPKQSEWFCSELFKATRGFKLITSAWISWLYWQLYSSHGSLDSIWVKNHKKAPMIKDNHFYHSPDILSSSAHFKIPKIF